MTESVAEEIRTLQSLVWSERDPDGRGFASLADAHRRAGEPRKAFEILNEGLVRLPAFASGHVVAARLYVEQGLFAEGELAARRALELDPDNVSAMASLVKAMEGAGQWDAAAEARATLAALEPEVLVEEGLAEEELAEEGTASAGDDVLDIAALEPEAALESELDDEEDVLDVMALEPSLLEPSLDDEDVLDIAVLEPEPAEDLVLDVRTLAPAAETPPEWPEPDLPEDELVLAADAAEPILDMTALRPDAAEEEDTVLDIGALQPESSEDELVLDVAALEPDGPDEELVLDVGSLKPDAHEDLPEEEELVLDVAALEPDLPEEELVLEGAALESALPDPAPAARDVSAWSNAAGPEGGRGAPRIYTRTLGELYAKQGFTDRAADVFRQLLAENPDDAALAARVEELERATPRQVEIDAGPAEAAHAEAVDAQPADVQVRPERDEELEAIARDLTMNRDVHPEVDSPFAWAADAEGEEEETGDPADGPTVREYFGALLSWRSGREA